MSHVIVVVCRIFMRFLFSVINLVVIPLKTTIIAVEFITFVLECGGEEGRLALLFWRM